MIEIYFLNNFFPSEMVIFFKLRRNEISFKYYIEKQFSPFQIQRFNDFCTNIAKISRNAHK